MDRAGTGSFKQAVALDPNFAPAWAGLADAYIPMAYYGFARPSEAMPAAFEAAQRALASDPDCGEAHCALAGTALLWQRDLELAEERFQRAIALNPMYTQARCWYGLFYLQWTAGRLDEGVKEIRSALDADPLSGYATAVYTVGVDHRTSLCRSRDRRAAGGRARSRIVRLSHRTGSRIPIRRPTGGRAQDLRRHDADLGSECLDSGAHGPHLPSHWVVPTSPHPSTTRSWRGAQLSTSSR